jgi:hypothetical protein
VSRFVLVCLECFHPMPEYEAMHMDCTDCPHCGDHKHGARQQQLDKPCTSEATAP